MTDWLIFGLVVLILWLFNSHLVPPQKLRRIVNLIAIALLLLWLIVLVIAKLTPPSGYQPLPYPK